MDRKQRNKLVYNLSIIISTLILGIYTYPKAISEFFFLVVGIGIFFTIGLVFPRTKKNSKMIFWIGFSIMFIVILSFTLK
ncbi:hypothetical protein F0342_03805 [Bacillus sp. CH30_1T]|jgi:hypothetical protein|uniref:hypothetical protein n=1 Tax=Bacillus sp. CH30_1T TaxID=2604836 RepID=UPI0011F0421A|nr:hypothetical protein [Bacillus sp. CH30_1T]KAA0565825.1 hypothetical protein F0342_03805 [Bacillus sp. CH30_1T]